MSAGQQSEESITLFDAARRGLASVVRQKILTRCDKNEATRAMELAAAGGHLDCVKILLPVSDPKASDSQAL